MSGEFYREISSLDLMNYDVRSMVCHKYTHSNIRSLERDGFVHRAVEPTVLVGVNYPLTPLGVSLNEPIKHVREWAMMHVGDIS